jgi:hypothetical protein
MASTATIARDEDGRFMGASALVLWGIVDLEVMGSIACREGMALAADLQVDSFRLASDDILRGSLGVDLFGYKTCIRDRHALEHDLQRDRGEVGMEGLTIGGLGSGGIGHSVGV